MQTHQGVELCGPLTGGEYVLKGDVSSQFITGLLFALPLAKEDSIIRILPPFESRSYVGMTLDALARFGELYKTAWTRLSERHDEIPHFAEIAASFDKITATQQGRDLVHLFAETRSAAFRTAGDDLVATRNRAAFMIALAQYKRELAASAAAKPADVAVAATPTQPQQSADTKPARKRFTLCPVLGVGTAGSRLNIHVAVGGVVGL